ncbi:Conserved hypothetical protein containing putative HPr kinase/phosphorylase (HPrK/P) (HPr(Ser) kinase/phosphorylase) domain [Salinibacter ruber M8]|uniref:HPr kinase/phosphorylase C-terminal domain-containing protein n=1 Tax=Salinibacter ruber (strain M8) TaxID=761659 RepID=D5H530_SALRM|nr:Conserved hypothetical protein containing putative HPr kinase/phosphorylase (HPrK/P) (HPr(Ser) kinase/phosphorylase) domain [Salinibacter ruber M8]
MTRHLRTNTHHKVAKRINSYKAHGLRIDSEIGMPMFRVWERETGDTADLEILEARLTEEEKVEELSDYVFSVDGNTVTYGAPDVGFVKVVGGKKILVDTGARPVGRPVRLVVAGIGLATALHHRGYAVLHSSAVSVGGKAVLFTGHKQAGKSTMAAAFATRGYPIVADDIVSVSVEGACTVYPGTTTPKLWQDSMSALGEQSFSAERVHPDIDKFFVSGLEAGERERYNIGGVLSIRESENTYIEEVSFASSVRAIVEGSYISEEILSARGELESNFERCSKVAKSSLVCELGRPKDYSEIDEVVDTVQKHIDKYDASA